MPRDERPALARQETRHQNHFIHAALTRRLTAMIDLTGKRALVFGVASETSIAWAISEKLAAAGAQVTLGYQKRFLSRLMQLTKDVPWIEGKFECDVGTEESVESFFREVQGQFDIVVHAIGFAPATALGRPVVYTTQEDYETTMTVSAYSLVRIVRHALPRMNPGGSVLTLTYLGAERVVPGYRIMGTAKAALESLTRELAAIVGQRGVRVNAISAGPIRTLAASGVPGFDQILGWMAHCAPLKRNVTQEDVAGAALFFASDLSGGVTGEILYVDAGYHIMGVPPGLEALMQPKESPAPAPADPPRAMG
jgi:enoyl-[acyl-carrier protein] reductase I